MERYENLFAEIAGQPLLHPEELELESAATRDERGVRVPSAK